MWAPVGEGNAVLEHQLAMMGKQVQEINLRLLAIVEMVRQMNEDFYDQYRQHSGERG